MRNKIEYAGRAFEADSIVSINMHLATSLPHSSLEANTFTAVVKSDDPSIREFVRNTPLTYYHRDTQRMIAYMQSVDRVGPNRYKLHATSIIGGLIEREHVGGIYTGQTVEEVVAAICGSIPFIVKSSLKDIKLYGWLPYAKPPKRSARDNLAQVLFAIGATIKTDLDGVLRIEGLWDGSSGYTGRSQIYQGAAIKYGNPVSRVIVTEHQYVQGGEETTLFEGLSQTGDVITFDSPMHGLTASGFTILESGANYAVLSAGNGTLTGQAYLHNTRQISKVVTSARSGDDETVKSFGDATLVSLMNSVAVAERLANYYRCQETIEHDFILNRQSPGDVIKAYHAYDKKIVDACIQSLDITGSGILRASAKALVGFSPVQTGSAEYYDFREMLTSDGEFVVPEDVESLTVVCIGGGQGGYSGRDGSATSYSPTALPDEGVTGYQATYGAAGGAGGAVGQGGKIIQATMTVTPGQRISYSIGIGGQGGVRVSGGSAAGSPGAASVFGEISSDNGASVSTGFADVVTGEVFALPSDRPGIAGGKGAGWNGQSAGYLTGATIRDHDGRYWYPGPITDSSENAVYYTDLNNWSESGKGLGGGPAVGSNGSAGSVGAVGYRYAYTGTSGKGGDAVKPAKQTSIGGGGHGGHGGGGEGGSGVCGVKTESGTARIYVGNHGGPGKGSDGGDGGDGCTILYYSKPKVVSAGGLIGRKQRFFLDKAGRLLVV